VLDALDGELETAALDLNIVPGDECNLVTKRFNDTGAPYPREKTLHQLFEEQVRRAPEAVAARYDGNSVTYRDLDRKANQLANYLEAQGMRVGEYVAILMPRCLHAVVAQLAVLKCGGAYVPLDPAVPAERQAFMLRDCRARRVISISGRHVGLEREAVQWIDCSAAAAAIAESRSVFLGVPLSGSMPAYVMYTSGSTGTPKGVVIPHRAVSRLAINNSYARISSTDCIAHCSNPAFDASTFEIWGALLNGAVLLIVPHAVVLEAERFAKVLLDGQVTVLWLTVGLLAPYIETLQEVLPQLQYLITGGDIVDASLARRLMRAGPPHNILNAYGPTECTTFSTTYRIPATDGDRNTVPIGHPVSNTQVYILNNRLRPVPIGATGELCIGGDGIAHGYLNQPGLTAERFVADPFSSDTLGRLYRSGDLARWRTDGNIEFLGRNDFQLKVRGFRVELGEIEAQLSHDARVREAAVVAKTDAQGEKRLVAYVTLIDPNSVGAPSVTDGLRTWLASVLPEYMVPSAFIILKTMPLTSNGKVDRRALPAPEYESYKSPQYEPPEGTLETTLCAIWQGVLRVARVGRRDDFFELGGHSILATQVMVRIRAAFSIEVPMAVLFECPTIRQLAGRVDEMRQARLLERLASCGGDMEEMLERVALLSERKAQELLRALGRGEKS
jgi:amino acid adenylation domain-containing protein